MNEKFDELVSRIAQIGLEHHAQTLLENSRRNAPLISRTVREVAPNVAPALVISAGPSLYRQCILARLAGDEKHKQVTIIATDGAYIQCLKAGIKPDWVITIDPHPTRIVRWFGDHDYERNNAGDDYFSRQDLDIRMRGASAQENEANIALVDANFVKLAICSSAPANLVARTSAFDRYWFAPLVDSPDEPGLTRQICDATGLPALNTGGTVGTASWVFAHQVLGSSSIAVVGMDFGYPIGTPLENTQEWNLTGGDPDLYPKHGDYYTSPTYWWYRSNFLDLLYAADATVTNCSEAGLLYGDRVRQMKLEEWLKSSS